MSVIARLFGVVVSVGVAPANLASLDDLVFGEVLGSGQNGSVYAATNDQTQERFAVKSIPLDKLSGALEYRVASEIHLHSELSDHDHIVKFAGTLVDAKSRYIVTELCEGGDLNKELNKQIGRRFSENEAKSLLFQIAIGLKYLHEKYIIHRDLKMKNIFLDKNKRAKIGDFGYAIKAEVVAEFVQKVGTTAYMAPEMWNGELYSFPVDLWSFGVITYTLLFGVNPFTGDSKAEVGKAIVRGHWEFPADIPVSNMVQDFLMKLLITDPAKRMNISQVLGHPWFSELRRQRLSDCVNSGNGNSRLRSKAENTLTNCTEPVEVMEL